MGCHDALDVVCLVQEYNRGIFTALLEGREDRRRIVSSVSAGYDNADVSVLSDARRHGVCEERYESKEREQVL